MKFFLSSITPLVLVASFASRASMGFVPSDSSAAAPASSSSETRLTAEKTMFDTGFINEGELKAKSTFPIPEDKLLERAKEILSPQVGLGTKDGGECLADDFEFCAAVVGPIGKEEYLNALGSFKIEDGFDIQTNHFGLYVDPLQTNRVWFFNRVKGNHTGPFMGAQPTGKEIVYPPQVHHMDFNPDGKLKEYGFYTVDRRQGNTGGLGGAFGFMYAVGKPLPIPECKPYKKSLRFRMLNFVGRLAQKLKKRKEKKD